ncbi:ATP-binding cassette domain-containing protein [Peptoniphilus stercorisuis]|uniref:NitT/TauT family transport system ATP-binding protein n=1 Tax=Peptoniphilus stercorisuis TaxID=1436965 RepID=A0ABS4KCD2_9FIRM|nr:ATP-binding cassette domain-containing protein [Peptoniphilus stercorisuis]MBP2025424.1 NitT/TauT family transport system ATP-binding protein [Peptoniphilus stercorisuis]
MNILIKNLYKSFDDEIVIKNLNLEINSFDRVALVGKSGIGKTTFLRMLLGDLKADSGEIIFSEEPKYSVVFQENLLFENRSIYENIKFVKSANRDIVEKYLDILGVKGLLDKKVSQLSGGMKRRVSILRAIVYSGNIYILDEALREVDLETRDKIIYLLNESISCPLIFTTHDENDIKDLSATKVVNLETGEIYNL